MSSAIRAEALAMYRLLNRTCREVFRDDPETLNHFRSKLRQDFRSSAKTAITDDQAKKLLKGAEEINTIIRTQVFCVEKSGSGKNFVMRVRPENLS